MPVDILEKLLSVLTTSKGQRDELHTEWKKNVKQRQELNQECENIEQIVSSGNNFSREQIVSIEMMLLHFKDILKKQEEIILKRETILKEEQHAICEIEVIVQNLIQ